MRRPAAAMELNSLCQRRMSHSISYGCLYCECDTQHVGSRCQILSCGDDCIPHLDAITGSRTSNDVSLPEPKHGYRLAEQEPSNIEWLAPNSVVRFVTDTSDKQYEQKL